MMTSMERESMAAICLLAAFADGTQTETERAGVRDALAEVGDVPEAVFQRVLKNQTTLEDEARRINDAQSKLHAYELAVAVCNSDGGMNEKEKSFLTRLANALGLDAAQAERIASEGYQIASATLNDTAIPAGMVPVAAGAGAAASANADAKEKEVDGLIMQYAAVNAAIELLPQSLASIAILPLQTKMVYSIGKKYSYTLDSGHIKEFIATVGMGAAGQVAEGYARSFLSGLASRLLGKTAGKIVKKATGPAMTFATTYAMGQVAKSYYASGRTLSMDKLRGLFSEKAQEAKGLYGTHEKSIEATAGSLTPSKILEMVRGA